MDTEYSELPAPLNSAGGNHHVSEPQPNASNHPPSGPAGDAMARSQADSDLGSALTAAMASQQWLAAVWHVERGKVFLFRQVNGFPTSDLDVAQQLLRDDLRNLGQAS